jgi:hypothetical protein
MDDGIGLTEALLELEGFRVLDVAEGPDELVVTVESTAKVVGCSGCGVRAKAQDHMPTTSAISIASIARHGWCGSDADCDAKTWTEHSEHVDAQAVLTRRAGAERVPPGGRGGPAGVEGGGRGILPCGLSPELDHATRVADPFHVARVASRCLDKILSRGPERDARPSGPSTRSTAFASCSSPAKSVSMTRVGTGCC